MSPDEARSLIHQGVQATPEAPRAAVSGPVLHCVYTMLHSESWRWGFTWCICTTSELEALTGLTRNPLRAATRRLQKLGWLTYRQLGRGQATAYVVHVPRSCFRGDPPDWAPLVGQPAPEVAWLEATAAAPPRQGCTQARTLPLQEAERQARTTEPDPVQGQVQAAESAPSQAEFQQKPPSPGSGPEGRVSYSPSQGELLTLEAPVPCTSLDLGTKKEGETHTARVVPPQAGELPWSDLTPSSLDGLTQAFSDLVVVQAVLTVWFAYRKQPSEVRRPVALLRECLSGRGGWQLLSNTEIGDWVYCAARTLQRRTRIDSTGFWTDPLRAEVDALVDWLSEHRGGSLEGLFLAYTALCPTLVGPEKCSLYWLLSTCGGA